MKRILFAFLIVANVVAASRADTPTTAPTRTYTNPIGITLADPDVLYHRGVYYLYATSITNLGFRVWTSNDLVEWGEHDEFAFERDHQTWGRENFWAPDALAHGGKFYLFYSCVGPTGVGKSSHRICVAQSDSPLGPFKEVKAPLLDLGKAVIDAFAFIDDDGKPYLYYALDQSENVKPHGIQQSELYVIPLAPDLLSIAGEPKLCITPSQPWEGMPALEDTWNEAPFVFKHKQTYILMYSARVFVDPLYAVGYATSKSPLGPWKKADENPILKRRGMVSGPGHNSVIASPDGKELFIVYHTHKDVKGGWTRELNIDRMSVTESPEGDIQLRIEGPTRTPQKVPSGSAP